jgi:hypothetical protein
VPGQTQPWLPMIRNMGSPVGSCYVEVSDAKLRTDLALTVRRIALGFSDCHSLTKLALATPLQELICNDQFLGITAICMPRH